MKYLINCGPGIGDIIQVLSIAFAIRKQFPDALIDIIMQGTKEKSEINQQIMDIQNAADNLYWYAYNVPFHNLKLVKLLKRKKYDIGIARIETVFKTPSLWIYRIMRMVECKKIICSGIDAGDEYINIPLRMHYLDKNEMILNKIGIKEKINANIIDISSLNMKWIKELGIHNKTVLAFTLGTNPMSWKEGKKIIPYDVKSWAYSKWLELTKKMADEGYTIVLLGGKKEESEIKNYGLNFPNNDRIYNFIAKTDIRQSLSLLKAAKLAVGAEGGMQHCAGAVGTKTLTIFGGSDYKIWNPGGKENAVISQFLPCSPCFCTKTAAICDNHKCLNDISVDMVKAAILNCL